MSASDLVALTSRDQVGRSMAMQYQLTATADDAMAMAFAALVQACQDAHVAEVERVVTVQANDGIDGVPGLSADYTTWMALDFTDAGAIQERLYFVGPAVACFTGGGVVDPTWPDVANLVAYILANGLSSAGAAWVSWDGGLRVTGTTPAQALLNAAESATVPLAGGDWYKEDGVALEVEL